MPGGPLLRDRNWRVDRFWGYVLDRERSSRILGHDVGDLYPEELLELVLRRRGIAGVHDLTGQFAAVLRHEADGRVCLLTDHLGLVPMHWGRLGSAVVADADIEVVRDALWDGCSIDTDVVAAQMMQVPHWAGERTQFVGIRKVLPGTVTVIDGAASSVVRYFDPGAFRADTSLSPDACVDRMRAAVDGAVAEACEGQQVSSHLSGGLDSSVVTALALRHARHGIAGVFTWTPKLEADATEAAEQRALRLVEQHLNVKSIHASYEGSREHGLLALDPMVYPSWGYLIYEWQVLCQSADLGVSSVLSGWGGDDAASAPTPVNPWAFIRSGYAWRLHQHLAARARTRGHSEGRAAAALGRAAVRNRLPRKQPSLHAFAPAWLPRYGSIAEASMANLRPAATAQEYMTRRQQYMALTWRTDTWWKAGHGFGIEYRYPLLDQRVLRAALTMPAWYFHGEGVDRWGFRTIARSHLPAEIALLSKVAEPVRVHKWLESTGLSDRLRNEGAVSPELAALTRIQVRNRQMILKSRAGEMSAESW